MKKYVLALPLCLIALTQAGGAQAGDTKGNWHASGYHHTNAFQKMDMNGDGIVNFKEFQKHAQLDNEYARFVRFDADKSGGISHQEYMNVNQVPAGIYADGHDAAYRERNGVRFNFNLKPADMR